MKAAAQDGLQALPTMAPGVAAPESITFTDGWALFSNGTKTNEAFYVTRDVGKMAGRNEATNRRGILARGSPKLFECCKDCFSSLPAGTGHQEE